MKCRDFKALLICACLPFAAKSAETAAPQAGATLAQCYEWAKAQSEMLKIRGEEIKQAEARGKAALGSALPSISWELSDTWQDPEGVEKLEKKGFAGFVEKNQVESKFSIRQPIFSGLKEFTAAAGAEREKARNSLRLERASRDLFELAAQAFYAVLGHETDWENTEATLSLAQDRVKELRGFKRLGKARESELFAAEAQAAALKGRLEEIKGQSVSAREELSYLAGRDMSAVPLIDEIPSPPAFGTLEETARLAKDRSDLRAQRQEVALQKLKVRYERGAYWPTVDATGGYYTQRATFLDEIAWDVALNIKVPIFQGGTVASRVREASSVYRQSVLTLEEMERRAAYSVRKMHGQLTAAVEETKAREEAAQAARKSYDLLLKEYRLGLVTSLEVLQALDLLQQQSSARDAARLKMKLLYLQLNVAVERLP